MEKFDLIIIGSGVSGTICAINKNENIKTLLIDGNKQILNKFMITGKGKSNIANTSDIHTFLKNIIDGNKFLYPSLTKHNGNDILKFLDNLKIDYYEKEPNRVHLSVSNEKYRQNILKILNDKDVVLSLGKKVIDVNIINDEYEIELEDKDKYRTNNLVIATGGLSFSKLGSTGFGYKIGKKFNHKINETFPIGVGLHINSKNIIDLQGISLDNVKAKVYWDQKLKYEETGSLMFTHYGLGGPLIRRVSGYVTKYLQTNKKCKLVIEYINEKIVNDELNKNLKLSQCFKWCNKSIIKNLLGALTSLEDLKNIKKEDKRKIINALSNVTYEIESYEPIEQAINTGGGIDLKDINPNTMESKIQKRLYFIGEVLDVNPRTNGYNITVCYSTAMTCISAINLAFAKNIK